jgi:hypothetical protein
MSIVGCSESLSQASCSELRGGSGRRREGEIRYPADVVWDWKSFAILIHLSAKEYINI